MRLNRFDYSRQPLSGNEIRLLSIRPDERNESIRCDLFVKDLATLKGKFEALSYCWGKEQDYEGIIKIRQTCWIPKKEEPEDGEYKTYPYTEFPVTPNLLTALIHLRSELTPVLIWVDAICINQKETTEGIKEKNQQLSMMSDIYNSAKNVCIWLGPNNEKTIEAMKFVNTIMNFQTLDEHLRDEDKLNIRKESNKSTAESNGYTDPDNEWINLVKTLKETEWFSRRWIIQEIASARNASVHCGDEVIHWDDLTDAILLLQENQESLKSTVDKNIFSEVVTLSATQLVTALTNVCHKSSNGDITERLLDLETLVCTFQQFQARYPQDIIHSVRALAKDLHGAGGNRNSALLAAMHDDSSRDLFIAFVNHCIEHSRSLDIICRHWAPSITDTAGEEIELPSWISKLANGPFGAPGESHQRQNGENFVAMSPNDKRKRYNASDGWDLPNRKSDYERKPRLSQLKIRDHKALGTSRWPSVESNDPRYASTVVESPLEVERRRSISRRPKETQSESSEQKESLPTIQSIIEAMNPESRKEHTESAPDGAFVPPFIKVSAQSAERGEESAADSYIQEDKEHDKLLPGQLEVNGCALGTVRECSDVMRDGIIPGNWLAELGWNRKSTNNHVPEIVWRLLVADRNPEGGNAPGWYRRACLHCLKDTRLVNSRGDLNTHRADKISESMTLKYLRRVESVIWRRRIVRIETGSLQSKYLYGLAPEGTREGDMVCILAACSVPTVLRKIEAEDQKPGAKVFQLIGEAYVHGRMDGEAVREFKSRETPLRSFMLQ
ncbi:hypothetical protein BS50DRAFT_565416 [Corynespora cassiicola Philippines]|uniref:Heterokaryon incompatibility domain-containing protein n=1 Tax=Corynespora cassiicola Philippines TaxID=1448308 RepID=A0A2T2N2P5_CORCC|nr:hypothetical protein BS50DRAFT_565416 [Corynespora cassiicola Philippines]